MAAGTSGTSLIRSFRVPFCSSSMGSTSRLHLPTTRLSTQLPPRYIAQSGYAFHTLATCRKQALSLHSCPPKTGSVCTNRSTSAAGNHRSMSSINRRNNSNGSNRGSSGTQQKPPGTFATGHSWDKSTKPAVASTLARSSETTSTTSPTGPSITPRAPAPKIWESLKDELTSREEDKENSRTNIQMNLKKLEAISKVTKKRQAYSPYLLISSLPSTVMPDDIKRMSVSEGSITDIIYHRNWYMEFQNRVTVVFRSATDAVEFITQKYGKFLGGHKLNMNLLDPYNPKDKGLIPPQLPPEPLSGQIVLISGLPAAARPDSLRTEFRRFHLMDTTEAAIIAVPSRRMASTCQYLIRLSSRSEAYRFVRTYHNTYFQFAEYRKRCPIRATVIY
ncbi:MAG: hypothetical protein J3Q66DRAFT_327785 [Benniella sp.]|nr:MAG: hypothetical protein J3Q66DRAFT_327785 [Benniella sp.]